MSDSLIIQHFCITLRKKWRGSWAKSLTRETSSNWETYDFIMKLINLWTNLVEIGPVVLKKMKMWKVYTDGWTNDPCVLASSYAKIFSYIYIITVNWSEVPDNVEMTGLDHQRQVWSSDPSLSMRRVMWILKGVIWIQKILSNRSHSELMGI